MWMVVCQDVGDKASARLLRLIVVPYEPDRRIILYQRAASGSFVDYLPLWWTLESLIERIANRFDAAGLPPRRLKPRNLLEGVASAIFVLDRSPTANLLRRLAEVLA
jgi:hypothetical protein